MIATQYITIILYNNNNVHLVFLPTTAMCPFGSRFFHNDVKDKDEIIENSTIITTSRTISIINKK